MMLNRVALIAAVDKSIANNEAKHAEQVKAWDAWLVDYKARWLADKNPMWERAANAILDAVKAGEPVTESMVPDRYRMVYAEPDGSRHYNDGRPPKPSKVYRPDPELAALREILELIVDDEIALSTLNRLGITAKTMRYTVLKLNTKAVKS